MAVRVGRRGVARKKKSGSRFALFLAVPSVLLLLLLLYVLFTSDYFSSENKYDALIRDAAKRHCIDSSLLKAVIWKESGFDQNVKGSKGEIGLMQLRRKAAVQDWAEHNNVQLPCEGAIFNPGLNIEIGAWYLSKSMRKWDEYRCSDELGLCEYNAGGKKTLKWKPDDRDGDVIGRITYRSTRAYVESIMNKYLDYSERKARK